MTSVTLVVISDQNSIVSSHPDSVPRDFSDALLKFVSQEGSKAAADTVIRSQHNPVTAFYAKADSDRNFVGCAVHGEGDATESAQEENEALLDDLLSLAATSAMIPKKDKALRSYFSKTLRARVDAESAGAKRDALIAKAKEDAQIFKGVVGRKKSSSSAAPRPSAAANDDSYNNDDGDSPMRHAVANGGRPAVERKYPGDAKLREEAEAEQKRKDEEEAEEKAKKKKKQDCNPNLSRETAEEWEKFQETKQYKVSLAVLGLCAIISLVFFVCDPSLRACDFSVGSAGTNNSTRAPGKKSPTPSSSTIAPTPRMTSTRAPSLDEPIDY